MIILHFCDQLYTFGNSVRYGVSLGEFSQLNDLHFFKLSFHIKGKLYKLTAFMRKKGKLFFKYSLFPWLIVSLLHFYVGLLLTFCFPFLPNSFLRVKSTKI